MNTPAHHLTDGFSDDILAWFAAGDALGRDHAARTVAAAPPSRRRRPGLTWLAPVAGFVAIAAGLLLM